MTGFPSDGYDRCVWGDPIPADRDESYDFVRLERVVGELVERARALALENQALQSTLADQQSRVRSLEAQVLELNQRRQDVFKRIDDLIAQIDGLDGKLGGAGE